MRKVRILPGAFSSSISQMFEQHGYDVVSKLDDDLDLLVFSGGADVDPSLYEQHKHKKTYSDFNRDKEEIESYNIARELGIPCVGICRGGQLLHVLNGGKMWQDVDMHGRDHPARTFGTNIEVLVSSMHHQMMMQNDQVENIILLTSRVSTRKARMNDISPQDKDYKYEIVWNIPKEHPSEDIEALYYPETNCLCFQPHPELSMMDKTGKYEPMVELFFSYIDQYCFEKDDE